MNNPNNLFKTTGNGEPVDECPTLLEYVINLTKLTSTALEQIAGHADWGCAQSLRDIQSVVEEMAEGDWQTIVGDDGT